MRVVMRVRGTAIEPGKLLAYFKRLEAGSASIGRRMALTDSVTRISEAIEVALSVDKPSNLSCGEWTVRRMLKGKEVDC